MAMQDLPRWIKVSHNKYFSDIAIANNIPYFVEGIDERESTEMKASHIEIRSTGPFIKEVGNDYFVIDSIANILCTDLMQMTTTDAYLMSRWTGIFAAAMLEPIPIYRYGPGAQDDDTLVGCLRVKDGRYDAIKVYHFGQVSGTDRVKQSEVDGLFDMRLKGSEI